MSRQIISPPVARSTDPITSDWAGENQGSRRIAKAAVEQILWEADYPLSDWQIFQEYQRRDMGTVTAQRLRTARKELERDGWVVSAGIQYGASETHGRAQTWEWSQAPVDLPGSAYRRGPMGESQPVADHSADPLTPEVLS